MHAANLHEPVDTGTQAYTLHVHVCRLVPRRLCLQSICVLASTQAYPVLFVDVKLQNIFL